MPHHESHFAARDGLSLYEQSWLPEGPARAVVVLVHGINEHSGRYARLAGDLNQRGFAVYAMDLRGHGRSDGDRVAIRSFDQYLDDLRLLLSRVAAREPGKPLFLFGHSMGGTIAALLAIAQATESELKPQGLAAHPRSPAAELRCLAADGTSACGCMDQRPRLQGLILSAPAVVIAGNVFPILRRLASLFSVLWPTLRLTRMGCRFISRDPAVVEAFRNDPLVFHGRFPVRSGAEILRAAKLVQNGAAALRLPLLILHGGGDYVTDPSGSRRLHERAASTDKTLHIYPGLYHEVFSEPERDQVLADLLAWLDAHAAERAD